MNRDITVIIPNYNGASEVSASVKSALTQVPADRVIVVDDGSTDDSVAILKLDFPDIRIITSKKNRGFARAVNIGIRAAKTPYVFLLNNDARLTPGALDTLRTTMRAAGPRTFSVGAKMLTLAKPRKIDNCGDLYCALGWAFTPGRDADPDHYTKRASVTSTCAGAALYRRELLVALGLFDEAHGSYLEDVDLGIRARLAGYKNIYEPAAVVLHRGSATSGSRHNAFKVRLTVGNNLYLLYKNFPLPVLLLDLPLLTAGIIIKGLYFARKGLARSYLQGLHYGADNIRRGGAARKRARELTKPAHLLKLVAELYINLIRRVAG